MKYTIIDIETTGLKYKEGAEITEIAGINVVDGEIITAYSSLVNIEGFINDFIKNLTGITNKMVENAPKFEKVIGNMLSVLDIKENTEVVIHNVNFDYNFLKYYIDKKCDTNTIWLWNNIKTTCSLEYARKIMQGKSCKLEDLKVEFGIRTKSHRALNDVFVTKIVYESLLKRGLKRGII